MNSNVRQDIHSAGVPVICRSCEARHKGICGALTPEQLTQLAWHTSRHTAEPGKELIASGEAIDRYSNILSGVVTLSKLMADGRQQIVGLQFAPDFMGRPFKSQNEITAEAATEVRLCSFPRSALEKLMEGSPGLEHRLLEQSLRELDEARDWMITLGRKNASEKLASFLFMIAQHVDPELERQHGSLQFNLPLKRADIADFLGLTIETVSRQITRFRKAGIIEVENNRTILVRDLDRLRQACESSE